MPAQPGRSVSHNWTSGATEATALTRRGSRVTGRVRGDRLRVIHMQEPALPIGSLTASERRNLYGTETFRCGGDGLGGGVL